jgi:hypothetical protein
LKLAWKKPVIAVYREKYEKPETEPFAVVKAAELSILKSEAKEPEFEGHIKDFFPLMGNPDVISSKKGQETRYVLCWFDDTQDDINKAMRRLTGVTFSPDTSCVTDERGKRTYRAEFKAKNAKLD